MPGILQLLFLKHNYAILWAVNNSDSDSSLAVNISDVASAKRTYDFKACEEIFAVKFDRCASGRHRSVYKAICLSSMPVSCHADFDAATCFIAHIDDVKPRTLFIDSCQTIFAIIVGKLLKILSIINWSHTFCIYVTYIDLNTVYSALIMQV